MNNDVIFFMQISLKASENWLHIKNLTFQYKKKTGNILSVAARL